MFNVTNHPKVRLVWLMCGTPLGGMPLGVIVTNVAIFNSVWFVTLNVPSMCLACLLYSLVHTGHERQDNGNRPAIVPVLAMHWVSTRKVVAKRGESASALEDCFPLLGFHPTVKVIEVMLGEVLATRQQLTFIPSPEPLPHQPLHLW
jgi:hypothetical protein